MTDKRPLTVNWAVENPHGVAGQERSSANEWFWEIESTMSRTGALGRDVVIGASRRS